ncbi:MAG: hypothetical protein RL026_760 [Pseudomonadota bacterium]|jgi:flagellar M-ring protein FliF
MSAEAATVQASLPRIAAGLKPVLLLVGVAAAVAAGVGVVLWSQEPRYDLLFGNLSDADKAEVVASLQQGQIPYKLEEGTGAVLVPADQVSSARMRLASEGIPEPGGFSLMQENAGFGVSQFMEGARYQHAVETELARTITGLKPVEAARVHLALPQQSTFVRDRRPASASVFLKLATGRRLEREQVTAIVNLVASSVPGLATAQVTVIDSQGRLLSSPQGQGEFAVREEQLEIARRMEEDYTHRIESLLEPLLGSGRVRAQVVAQIDMGATEEAREQYRPDSQIVRSEQTSEEINRNGQGIGGVPGALSNQPPQAGAVPAPAPVQAATRQGAAGTAVTPDPPALPLPDSEARQASRNFEIDRTVAYTRQPAGRLTRLSVAVLIDNLRTTDAQGKSSGKAIEPAQLEQITALVKDAVGFDAQRGDTVSVVNQAFHPDTLPMVPDIEPLPVWEQPWAQNLARLLSGLVILVLLLLFVVRPLIRNLTGGAAPQGKRGMSGAVDEVSAGVGPEVAGAAVAVAVDGAAGAGAAGDAVAAAAAAPLSFEDQVAAARGMVNKDPSRVAQLVKDWVQADD